jgi:hypothetical protein
MFLYKIWQYFLRDLKTDLGLLFVVFNVSFHNTPFPSWIGDQFFFGRGNKGTPQWPELSSVSVARIMVGYFSIFYTDLLYIIHVG